MGVVEEILGTEGVAIRKEFSQVGHGEAYRLGIMPGPAGAGTGEPIGEATGLAVEPDPAVVVEGDFRFRQVLDPCGQGGAGLAADGHGSARRHAGPVPVVRRGPERSGSGFRGEGGPLAQAALGRGTVKSDVEIGIVLGEDAHLVEVEPGRLVQDEPEVAGFRALKRHGEGTAVFYGRRRACRRGDRSRSSAFRPRRARRPRSSPARAWWCG